MSKDLKMGLARNNSSGPVHPINLVAEYSFGRICEDHYLKKKAHYSADHQLGMDHIEKCYKLAITLGLTSEMSVSGCDEAKTIWAKVDELLGDIDG